MIKYKVIALLEDKSQKEGKKITLSDLAREIGIQSSAMSKIANNRGYYSSLKTIEELCKFFDCSIEDVVEIVPDEKK